MNLILLQWVQKIKIMEVNNETEPVLVVEPLKLGKSFGSIALWCDVGTDAYFKNLRIVNLDLL